MSGVPTPIGEQSTLFLVYSYEAADAGPSFDLDAFEQRLCAEKMWQFKQLDDTALLPHLDSISEGQLVRRYTVGAQLGNLFGERAGTWTLRDRGKDELVVRISDAPTVYAFETGYVFIAIGVQPVSADLETYQDTLNALVRRGAHRLAPESLPEKVSTWAKSRQITGDNLRTWLAALVPGLPAAVPAGGRENPNAIGVVFADRNWPFDVADRHRLRLAHTHTNDIAPSDRDRDATDHPSIWSPSANEQCLFSPFGVQWLVNPVSDFLGTQLLSHVRSSYLYKWMLVAHQRLYLLKLTAAANRASNKGDVRGVDPLRVALLQYTAQYNSRHISEEERHDEFYRALRAALDIEGLYDEAREEITELHEHAGARRAERLNNLLAFLTVVLTPMGLVIGVFQRETFLGQQGEYFPARNLVSASYWAKLLQHGPFQLLLICALLGSTTFLFFRSERRLRDVVPRKPRRKS